MGYYTGAGVNSGGGSSVTLRETGPSPTGAYYIYQRTNSTVNVKSGVSLAVASAAEGDMNMTYWQKDSGSIPVPNARGTKKSVSYSQIGGSNLYTLTTTDDVVQMRCKQGTYDSGWVS